METFSQLQNTQGSFLQHLVVSGTSKPPPHCHNNATPARQLSTSACYHLAASLQDTANQLAFFHLPPAAMPLKSITMTNSSNGATQLQNSIEKVEIEYNKNSTHPRSERKLLPQSIFRPYMPPPSFSSVVMP